MRKALKYLLAATFWISRIFSPIKSLAEEEVIFNQNFPINMFSDLGGKTDEQVKVRASLDEDTDTLSVGIYTQDYDRKNWKGDKANIPIYNRHTLINNGNSRLFVLRPSRAKISEIEQKAFLVPRYQWITDLLPYEKRESTQLLVETTDNGLEGLISEIPFFGEIFGKFLKDAKSREEEYYNNLFEGIEGDYTATRILPFIPKGFFGQSETAREYIIKFDVGNISDEIPLYLWLKIALGDPSIANHNAQPNRYGELENISVKFSINKDSVTRDELDDYLLHRHELESINLSKRIPDGASSNPDMITVRNIQSYNERKQYEDDRVTRLGIAEYLIPPDKSAGEEYLTFGVVQFESEKARADFMERRRNDMTYPLFVKGSILSTIYSPTMKELTSSKNRFSDRQCEIYADIILDYMKRTGMSVMLDENPVKSERLLKQIENYKQD